MRFSISCLINGGHYSLVVVGGGTGGCAVAHKFSRILKKPRQIAVVEPQTQHFYQPGFTLSAAGLVTHSSLMRWEHSLLPSGVNWIRSGVQQFLPNQSRLLLEDGQIVTYEFLVIATGIELRFDMIEGLPDGRKSLLAMPAVSSIYFPEGALKTQAIIRAFTGGTALFTFPNTPIKCAGAPQKICYLAEEDFRLRGVRDGANVLYCTALPRIFGVPKYADALMKIIEQRGIQLRTRLNLAKIDSNNQTATFQVLDENAKPTGQLQQIQYDLLHVGPPCSPVASLRNYAKQQQQYSTIVGAEGNGNANKSLTDVQGFVRVDPGTLQSVAYQNVFAIGDCANTPNAKTAAAISSQLRALVPNLKAVMMENKKPEAKYDGYASCPLVVDRRHTILAEFNPQGPLETFPFNQAKPTRFSYFLKRFVMPSLYWHGLLKGFWLGPGTMRKIFHPFGGK